MEGAFGQIKTTEVHSHSLHMQYFGPGVITGVMSLCLIDYSNTSFYDAHIRAKFFTSTIYLKAKNSSKILCKI